MASTPTPSATAPTATPTDNRSLSVTTLKGVGGKMAETLATLGAETLGDLLMHMPSRYLRIGEVKPISAWQEGQTARLELDVISARVRYTARIKMVDAVAQDSEGTKVALTWFGQQWLAKQLPGKKIVCQGELTGGGSSKWKLDVREWSPAEEVEDADRGESLRPIYPATEGLSQKRIRQIVTLALEACPLLPDRLPRAVREQYGLPGVAEALRLIHQPAADTDPKDGRRRLVFDELFPAQLALLLLRRLDAAKAAPALADDSLSERMIAALPFALSAGQVDVWATVRESLALASPSRLLVQGEVGAGKTVIAALAAAQAAAAGKVTCILAPTEILARQHALSIAEMLAPAGIQVELVTGSQPAAERERSLASLSMEISTVAIGTHALLSDATARFAEKIALVVVDEQHRFGVGQRHRLVDAAQAAGSGVHLLQLSATPIPRTLAMTVFGDLDVLDLPIRAEAKRQVATHVIAEDAPWLEVLRRTTEAGAGAFVICPRIDEDVLSPGRAVLSPALTGQLLHGFRVDVAHGRQTTDERSEILRRFAEGELDVLVATTVIEVGIDIPRASAVVILDADRFGLATLHQLRGRVGRAGQEAVCILVPSASAGEEGLERLQAMVELDDGMALAEFDLKLRGSGAILGDAQAGGSGFKVARLERDGAILNEARKAALALLDADPQLVAAEHRALKTSLLAEIGEMLRVRQG